MKIFASMSFGLFVLSSVGVAQENGDCTTYIVTNENAHTSTTVTRCRSKSIVDSIERGSERKVVSNTTDEAAARHGYPFNTYSELDAQLSIAESTDVIKTYTRKGFFVGVAGLLFLGWTLRATRAAAEAANRTAQAAENAERAYILPVAIFEYVDEDGKLLSAKDALNSRIFIRPTISAKNFGRTPAIEFEFEVYYQPWDMGGAIQTITGHRRLAILATNEEASPEIDYTGPESIVICPGGAPDDPDYVVWLRIRYNTIFDKSNVDNRTEDVYRYEVRMGSKYSGSAGSSLVPNGELTVKSQRKYAADWPVDISYRGH